MAKGEIKPTVIAYSIKHNFKKSQLSLAIKTLSGRRLTWVVSTSYDVQVMCYRILLINVADGTAIFWLLSLAKKGFRAENLRALPPGSTPTPFFPLGMHLLNSKGPHETRNQGSKGQQRLLPGQPPHPPPGPLLSEPGPREPKPPCLDSLLRPLLSGALLCFIVPNFDKWTFTAPALRL